MLKISYVFLLGIITANCALFNSEKSNSDLSATKESEADDKPQASHISKGAKMRSAQDDIELKQAQIWRRLDEIEMLMLSELERVELLERGLKTGIIPDKLKKSNSKADDGKKTAQRESSQDGEFKEIESQIQIKSQKKPLIEKQVTVSEEKLEKNGPSKKGDQNKDGRSTEEIKNQVAKVQDLYRAGQFGKALAELEAIQKQLGDTPDGIVNFWIARSWLGLKELSSARNSFEAFIAAYPTSEYIGRAHLDLARVEQRLGLKNKSVNRLKEIIKTFPDDSVAEMAQMELEGMKKTL